MTSDELTQRGEQMGPVVPEEGDAVHVANRAEHGVTAGAARARALTSLVSRASAVVVLIITMILGKILDSSFLTSANLHNIAVDTSYIAIMAAGMTFVIISGGIDLSVGSVFALSAIISQQTAHYGSIAAVLLPLLCCGFIGFIQGSLVAWVRMPAFIVTLAGLIGVRGIVYYVTAGGNRHTQVTGGQSFLKLGTGEFLTLAYPVWITLAVFAAGWWALNRTAYGQAVQAIGGSSAAAARMGLPVRRVTTMVYVVSGLCAGLAGVLTTARFHGGQEARIGDAYELTAIAAVVIGGTLLTGGVGSITGTLAGIMLWFVIRNIIVQGFGFSPYVQLIVSGEFLLVVVVLQTLLARRASSPDGH